MNLFWPFFSFIKYYRYIRVGTDDTSDPAERHEKYTCVQSYNTSQDDAVYFLLLRIRLFFDTGKSSEICVKQGFSPGISHLVGAYYNKQRISVR